MGRYWKKSDDALLIQHCKGGRPLTKKVAQYLAGALGRTEGSIRNRLNVLQHEDETLERTNTRWSTEEDAVLIEAAKEVGGWFAAKIRVIVRGKLPDRTEGSIASRVAKLQYLEKTGLTTNGWTLEEDDILLEYLDMRSDSTALDRKDADKLVPKLPGRIPSQILKRLRFLATGEAVRPATPEQKAGFQAALDSAHLSPGQRTIALSMANYDIQSATRYLAFCKSRSGLAAFPSRQLLQTA